MDPEYPDPKFISKFETIEDVADPEGFNYILSYYDDILIEDGEYMDTLQDKFKYEAVTWEQPWYQSAMSLTRPPNNKNDGMEAYRTDTISSEETEIIEKNWRRMRKEYKLPKYLTNFARFKNYKQKNPKQSPLENTRRFVMAYLCKGLNRTPYHVYRHVITYYGAPVKGRYSELEEKIIEVCYYHSPVKANVYASMVLGREPRGINNRIHYISNGKPQKKKIKWTLEQASKLVNNLLQYTNRELEDLKDYQIKRSVWLKLQDDFDHNYINLQKFWVRYLHNQLFIKQDIKLNKIKKKILRRLKKSHYRVWPDIRWKELTKQFPEGFTSTFLYGIAKGFLSSCPNYLKIPLQKVVEYGYDKLNSGKRKNRRLKNLVLDENKKLMTIRYD